MTLGMLIVMMLGTVIEIVTEISMVKAMVRVGKSQKTRNTQTVKLVAALMRTILESMPPRQKKT